MDFAADVLICGAGAAGLTLAIDLARRGISFRLIEKQPGPFQGSRGKGIQPRSQEIFEDLGVLDRIVAAGGLYPPMLVYRAGEAPFERALAEKDETSAAEPYHLALMCLQSKTEHILRERLAELGGRVDFHCELQGFTQEEAWVEARLCTPKGEERQRFRYLIGADGGRSFVRHELAIDFPGKTMGVRAAVADLRLKGLDRGHWHQFNEGDMQRLVSLCPLGGSDLFQLQAPVPPSGEVDLSAAGFERMMAERCGPLEIKVTEVAWASLYAMNARLAESYRSGRVFLIGDAAHIHPPTGGQGLNTSLQDGYNLGWKLAAVLRGGDAALLDSYEAERRPVAAEMLGLTSRLLQEDQSGPMRRGRALRQLDIGYPLSPLSWQAVTSQGGLHAGDRAPDAPFTTAAGQVLRLFQLMKGPQWTALLPARGGEGLAPRQGLHIHRFGAGGEIRDTWGHFQAAYGLGADEALLIRPDGYIGAIFSLEKTPLAEIETYLSRMGLPAGGLQ